MATTRTPLAHGAKLAPTPEGYRLELPLADGTPLVVHFHGLTELGVLLAHSPIHWTDAASVIRDVRACLRVDEPVSIAGGATVEIAEPPYVNSFVPPDEHRFVSLSGVAFCAALVLSAGIVVAAVAKVAECVWYLFG